MAMGHFETIRFPPGLTWPIINPYSLATTQVDDHFRHQRWSLQKLFHNAVDCLHAQPVSSIDGWRPSLRLANKVLEEVRLGIIKPFHASFGNNTAVIGGHDEAGISLYPHAWSRAA